MSLSLYFSVTTVHRSDLFGTFFFICQYSIPCSIDVSTSIRGCLRLYACTVEAFTLNVYIFQLENSLYASVRDVEAIGRHTCNGHIYNLVNCNHCHYRVVTHCKFSISLWMLHVLAPSTSNPRTSSKRKRKLIVIFIFIANFHCGAIDVCVCSVSATFPLKSSECNSVAASPIISSTITLHYGIGVKQVYGIEMGGAHPQHRKPI